MVHEKDKISSQVAAIKFAISDASSALSVYGIIESNRSILLNAVDLGIDIRGLLASAYEKMESFKEKQQSDRTENQNKEMAKLEKYIKLDAAINAIDQLFDKYSKDPQFKLGEQALNGNLKEKELNKFSIEAVKIQSLKSSTQIADEAEKLEEIKADKLIINRNHEAILSTVEQLAKQYEEYDIVPQHIQKFMEIGLKAANITNQSIHKAETLELHLEPEKTVEKVLEYVDDIKIERDKRLKRLAEAKDFVEKVIGIASLVKNENEVVNHNDLDSNKNSIMKCNIERYDGICSRIY